MADELTTRPMLEALLEGQSQLASQMTGLLDAIKQISDNQGALDARQDRLEVRVTELISRVEDGFDDTNRKIEIFNDRLLSFETWLKKVDRRLHDEILVRAR
jgi:predicted transcriptional regulator